MRDLDEYGLSDWLKAVPLVAGFKEIRDAAIREVYCAFPARQLDPFLERNADLAGGDVAVTIAFEQAWLIRHLAERFGRYCSDVRLIVLDNSRSRKGRSEIAAVCESAGVPYLGLPTSPVLNINRSHGNALNWAYRHVIARLRPKRFGFFDHDLFPQREFSMRQTLGDQPFYGLKLDRGFGWALWAGYCMFDTAFVLPRRPDFNPDMDRRLITGGRNYRRLYRPADPAALRFATRSVRFFTVPGQEKPLESEMVDGWLHIGGSSYHQDKLTARAFYEDLLEGDVLER